MAIHINIIDILKVQGVFCTHCGHRIDGCVWIVGVIVKRAVRKYKQARNGKNGVTPKYQVLTLIVITIVAISAKHLVKYAKNTSVIFFFCLTCHFLLDINKIPNIIPFDRNRLCIIVQHFHQEALRDYANYCQLKREER